MPNKNPLKPKVPSPETPAPGIKVRKPKSPSGQKMATSAINSLTKAPLRANKGIRAAKSFKKF